jgi:hypothetical protein
LIVFLPKVPIATPQSIDHHGTRVEINDNRIVRICPGAWIVTRRHVIIFISPCHIHANDDHQKCKTMAATMALKAFNGYSPATQALEEEQNKIAVAKGSRRRSFGSIDGKLSCELSALNFEDDDIHAFPAIEWESNVDLDDSDSVRSNDSWSSFFSDLGGTGSKRGRSDNLKASRRLVRSKKIKSDLSSLARSMSARSA